MARVAKENVREKILEAAQKRLWHYGIKKTTIDEIAADAGVGKGTVYLYFDSKEDISLAILAGYKINILRDQKAIVLSDELNIVEKIRQFLTMPVMQAHQRCDECPEALDLITVLKPHLADHMRPYFDEEIGLLARLLEDGNRACILDVEDTEAAARSLKIMTIGLMPPYPYVTGVENIAREISLMVDLVFRGLRSRE